ncbi:hypothetical protein NON20_23455 [Synechocystis sp. B12]|jgi:hypothetical protein|uniref:type II toxin-antitoxin system Phd/YefM family antitoxin n=1 Tax=Synechocystis sp. CACIAM 05 TaxID=1933929 RepID=UPI00138E6F09|nr:type II toxin-antitoxin system Phd/YefM family antitoxin [Synechocystis sp. CACIAM 05]QHV01387.1 prevent-host-death family protein [Synechocystis sp. CACIAM 05]WLT38364.1 hypothetical protein NON20_23455 [Synechocystis sp. B12]
MLNLHPNFIAKNGKNEFVVLTYDEFTQIQSLLEDLEDLQDLRQAKQEQEEEPTYSLEEVKAMLDDSSP